jgi:hypothetical protein
LRDLAPSYQLQQRGYKLPVPRLKKVNLSIGVTEPSYQPPMDLRDVLRKSRVTIAQLPHQYPDLSVAWVFGRELLLAQDANKQVIPCVIEARDFRPPDKGVASVVEKDVLDLVKSGNVTLLIIIDDFSFGSKSRTKFLLSQIDLFSDAKFLILTKERTNAFLESDFATKTSALIATVAHLLRAPCKGAISQWETDPPGNFRSGR